MARVAAAFWVLCHANPGWLLSLGIHGALFGSLALVVIHHERDNSQLGIEAALSDRIGESTSFESVMDNGGVEVVDAGGSSGGEAQAALLSDQASASARMLSELGGIGNPGAGQGTGEGDGIGSGRGPGVGAGFFGSKSQGHSFVYVVDMSGSMNGRRFERAKAELVRSINRLNPEQAFYVVFFNDRMLPLFDPVEPPKNLLPASANNKTRAIRWIKLRTASSTTNPLYAMELALSLKPDAVFLLTDGELDDPELVKRVIRQANKSNTQVHTIAFENEEGGRTLEAIAKENNGTFRFVKAASP